MGRLDRAGQFPFRERPSSETPSGRLALASGARTSLSLIYFKSCDSHGGRRPRHRSSSLACGCTRLPAPAGGEEMANDTAVQIPSAAPTYHSSRIPCRTAWVLVPSSSMCPRPLLLRVTLRANPLAGSRPKRVARASIASGLDLNFSVTSVEGQHATKNDARPGRPGIVPCFITTAQV